MSRRPSQRTPGQQSSPAQEQRRANNARMAAEARRRAKAYEERLTRDIVEATRKVEELRAEKVYRIQRIENLQSQLVEYEASTPFTSLMEDSFAASLDASLYDQQPATNELLQVSSASYDPSSTLEDLSTSSLGSSDEPGIWLDGILPWDSMSALTTDSVPASSFLGYEDIQEPSLEAGNSLPWDPRPGTSSQDPEPYTSQVLPPVTSIDTHLNLDAAHSSPGLGTPTQGPQSTGECDVLRTKDPSKKRTSPARRKNKYGFSYLWPPQEDPNLEARRQRAIKAHEKRRLLKSQQSELQQNIQRMQQEVQGLKNEKETIQRNLEKIEQQLQCIGLGEACSPIGHET